MPFFCFIVEPLRDAEGFFDSLCALLELGQLLAGRAQEQVAAGLAVLIAHFADRDVWKNS